MCSLDGMTQPRRSERARTAILDAATDLVGAVPYAKLSVEAIAARAGVGKQTIYRWWPSKGAVVFDALLARDAGPDGLAIPDTGDLRADLTNLVRATVAELVDASFDGFLRAVYIEVQQDAALAETYRERLLLPQRAAIAERLASAVAAGDMRSDVPIEVALDLLLGPIQSRWALGLGGLDDDYADAVVELVLRAL